MAALPKLSYVLLSHNRERYIRAAVESALVQDYEGELEYIFSDDCSTDRTFEIIKECVAAYKGPRRIVVTQPPANLKTAGNFNHALSFAKGDWVIRADDDDLSVANRCSVVGMIASAHPECMYVALDRTYTFQSENEDAARARAATPSPVADLKIELTDISRGNHFDANHYCYLAWNIKSYLTFGKLDSEAYWADDYILFLQAAIMGPGALVSGAPLYLIRTNSQNQSLGKEDGAQSYSAIIRRELFFDAYQNITHGLLKRTFPQLKAYTLQLSQPEQEKANPFFDYLEGEIRQMEILRTYWRKGTLNRLRIARKLGWNRPYDFLRCLPMPLFAFCCTILRRIASLTKNLFTVRHRIIN